MRPVWTQEALNALPSDGVFRFRGHNVSRLETFIDAAFAFAVTLLVISIDDIPDNYDDFVKALLQTPAFLACFFQLMMFWLGHRSWSRRYGLENGTVVWISLFLVAGVLIIVYPLRLMYGSGFAYISNGIFPSEIDFEIDQLRTIFLLYGSGFGFLSFLIAMLFWLAKQSEAELGLSGRELHETRSAFHAWLILSGTGLVSVIIAVLAEGLWLVWAGWIYMLLVILMPLQSWFANRGLARLEAD